MKKYILTIIAIGFIAINTQAIANSVIILTNNSEFSVQEEALQSADWFEKISDLKGVNVVYISKAMLGMMPNTNMGDINVGQIAGKLNSLEIYSVDDKQSYDKVRGIITLLINSGEYETMMRVKDSDSNTVFYSRKKKSEQQESEMIMISEDKNKKELSIIRFIGIFTVKEIQDLQKNK